MTSQVSGRSLISFILIICTLSCFFSSVASASEKRNVLILNSYHHGYKWTDDETSGILTQLAPLKNNLKIYIEYMGTKWISDRQYFDELRSTYKHKFGKVPFDVIIATDDDAFDFLLRYRTEIFGKVPVVFCGVNWFKPETIKGRSRFTGVDEDADIQSNLDTMLKLYPRTKLIYFIIDSTTTGLIVHSKVKELMPVYRNKVEFRILSGITMEELLDTLSNAPNDSLVLLTVFQQDKAGVFFEFNESTAMISRSSRVPVFGLWDFNLGYGIVGGMLTSGSSQGSGAGGLAMRILNGELPAAIPVIMKSPNRYMFDYIQMERYGIKPEDLPSGSIIINEPSSFYAVNKGLVWGFVSGIAVLTIIIFILLINIQKRKHAEESLRAARDGLEITVQQRTADLVNVNEMLRNENAERRRAEDEIKKLIGEIGEFNQEMETLMSERTMSLMALTIADKIRNPATLISGLSARLLEKGEVPEKLKDTVETIIENSKKVETIVSDFQSLLKSRQSMFTYEDLNQIVETVVSLLQRNADEKQIGMSVSRPPGPLMINTQLNLLRIAIFHVIKNALESTPSGGKISVSVSKQEDGTALSISDTGPGIPRDVIANIFDPFFSTKERRYGMGLPLVKQVIAEHMGKIEVDSEEEKGTTFRMIFPERWKEKE